MLLIIKNLVYNFNMDKLDKKIIFELQKNGRLSNFQIADKVGLSPSPCLRRIKNLEKKGVICGYTAIVNEELFGLPIIAFVFVRLENQTDATLKTFGEHPIDKKNNGIRIFGKSWLATHKLNNIDYQYAGYFGKKELVTYGQSQKDAAVSIWNELELAKSLYLNRNNEDTTGTSALIVGFKEPIPLDETPSLTPSSIREDAILPIGVLRIFALPMKLEPLSFREVILCETLSRFTVGPSG